MAVRYVDVYPVRFGDHGMEALVLRRGPAVRCAGAWETVHGHIEAGELPVDAARRELREETGLVPERLYNLSRIESFYLHRTNEVALIPVFGAIVGPGAEVVLSHEHEACRWLPVAEARAVLAWPRERRALDDLVVLLGPHGAGPLEDVLRVV